jgi:hypothetical protein
MVKDFAESQRKDRKNSDMMDLTRSIPLRLLRIFLVCPENIKTVISRL